MTKPNHFKPLMAWMLMLAFCAPIALANNTLTVSDGSDYSYSSPINFVWVDNPGTRSQALYPADSIAEMIDEPINSVRFYLWDGCGSSGGRLSVSVGETTAVSFGTYVPNLTQVATISLTAGVEEILITFDTPYIYHGGNLVIETVVEEKTNYSYTFFAGTRTATFQTWTRGEIERFLPKATFDYGANDDYAAKVLPKSVEFNTIRAGLEDVQTVIMKNIGQLPFTPTFSVTAPFATTVLPVSIAADETLEVPICFAPQTMGDYTDTLTIDCGQAGLFEIPLHGTALEGADYLTVCESNNYTTYLPVDGLYMNMIGTEGQMIYPANMLTDMLGRRILAIDYHPKDLYMNGGELTLSLKVTDNDRFADVPVLETGLTAVAVTSPVSGENKLSFVLDEPFEYNGGNLLIDVKVTVAGDKIYTMSSFYGMAMNYCPSMDVFTDDCVDYWKEAVPFLPMLTFSYSLQEPEVGLRGDIDQNGTVSVSDVTALIDYLLNHDAAAIDESAADVDLDGTAGITDVSCLIDYLLNGAWE